MWIEIAGWGGMVLLLTAYGLNSSNRIKSDSFLYQWANFFGAVGIVINTYYKQAWAPMVLDIIWAGIALYVIFSLKKSNDPLRTSNT